MSAPSDQQQNVTWHEFSDNLAALVKRILPELDMELLAANKPSQRHKGDGPPRERNSFFIYKSYRWGYYRKLHEASGEKIHVPAVTKKISADWHSLSSQEQKKWRLAAILQQINHRKANPNYKYSPNRGTQKRATKRPRADGEGGRTRKKSCNEKRAVNPSSMETGGMILEPFSVHPQPIMDDTFANGNPLLDDPVEFQALWNEFTNGADLVTTTTTASEFDTNSPEMNGAETPISMESLNIETLASTEPVVSAEQLSGMELLDTLPFFDSTDASNGNFNNASPYNVDENQFVTLGNIYNNAMPVSPAPSTPMLSDTSPLLQGMSPIPSEASPVILGAHSFDDTDMNNFGQLFLGQYECDAFNGYMFDDQQCSADFVLFDGSNSMFDTTTPRDPAVDN